MAGEDNLIDAGKEFEVSALRTEIQNLKKEITKYKILLNEVDEDANVDIVSDEEAICVEQIRILKMASGERPLTNDEVKKLDILHRNLKLARGEMDRITGKSKAGKLSVEELAKIAKGK